MTDQIKDAWARSSCVGRTAHEPEINLTEPTPQSDVSPSVIVNADASRTPGDQATSRRDSRPGPAPTTTSTLRNKTFFADSNASEEGLTSLDSKFMVMKSTALVQMKLPMLFQVLWLHHLALLTPVGII
ncbi:UNVERIFIED_CONTAM: hypothetical protein HDU68_000469 [Siphonaria sp. JEL0065]|nr:hypothetical protein HDU68_000469 [Siphonaria sp. JEL0065]